MFFEQWGYSSLNALGKVLARDVLMMCVSAGKSIGEIDWRRCEGIGSR